MLSVGNLASGGEAPRRSGREARRLWYCAPERVLRLKRYGPEVTALAGRPCPALRVVGSTISGPQVDMPNHFDHHAHLFYVGKLREFTYFYST